MKIALFGKIRSGKDTVGKLLIEEYGFSRVAFGDGIGEIIKRYFPEAWVGGKPRKHYQHIGQQLRVLNPDVWINYLLKTVEAWEELDETMNITSHTVVTDGRQVNEAKRLKEEGFVIVRVTTDTATRLERMKSLGDVFTKEDLLHETELNVDLIEPDIEIFNNGTLEDLRERVKEMIEKLQEEESHE